MILLGSTGSIGRSTLKVVEHLASIGADRFEVVGLAAGANDTVLREQAEKHQVRHVAIADSSRSGTLNGFEHLYTGSEAALDLIRAVAQEGDLIVGAMVGSAGVPATLAAIDRGCHVALANKETLVAAGALVMPLVRERGVTLLPVDSEHSAVFQCLLSGRSVDEVRRLVITASGGPFRTWPRVRIEEATVEEALNHPTWDMGPKVTIDSASLMNKALEIIEAHWLFGLPAEKIDAIVHPQSLVHSFVEFVDGSVIAQLGPPDMKTPIQYALTWPHRRPGCSRAMEWSSLRRMDFEPIDHERFGAVRLAYDVINRGGTSGAVFNAANEAAVEAFIAGRIAFGQITTIVGEALAKVDITPVRTMEDVLEADRRGREFVAAHLDAAIVAPHGRNRAPIRG